MRSRLRDLAEVHYGKSPNDVLSEDSTVPVIGTGGVYGRATRSLFSGPAVVVARKGTLGNPQFVDEPFWPVDTTYAVLAKPGVDTKWLYYSLAAFDLTKLNEATGVPSISRDWLYRVLLGSTDFVAQRRIAEILSTLDEAIEQTEALIAKHQQIKAGLMHDLFTRGVTPDGRLRPTREQAPDIYKESPLGRIPKEWEVATVGSCLNGIDAGKSPDCPDTPASDDQWGVLKVGAVHPEGLRESENKTVLDELLKNSAFLVRCNDLLLSRANTLDLVGLVCHVTSSPKNIMLSDKTLRLQPDTSRATTRFLFLALQAPSARRQIENSATGTSGSMKNISQGNVRAIHLVRPDLTEQSRITNRIDALAEITFSLRTDLAKLRHQKHGLMHDLLTGRVRVKEG